MARGDVQAVQDLCVGQVFRRDVAQVKTLVHQLSVARLFPEHGKRLVETVEEQPRLLDAHQPVLKLDVVHGDLGVDKAEYGVEVLQRFVQLLGYARREALQRPGYVAVILQHLLCIVVHIALFRLGGPARRVVVDMRVFKQPAPGQHLQKSLGLPRELAFLLFIKACACNVIGFAHIRCLRYFYGPLHGPRI